MRFKDIKIFRDYGYINFNVHLEDVPKKVEHWKELMNLQLEPDFKRGHVWTDEQRTKYMEFLLRHGKSGRDIIFNHTKWDCWNFREDGEFVCIDGLQRLTTCLKFFKNEVKVFGYYYHEFEDDIRSLKGRMPNMLTFAVNDLPTRTEVLEWYLQMKGSGTVHSEEDFNRVRKLLEKEIR